VRREIERCRVRVGNLDPRRIGIGIDGALDVQAGAGRSAGDELDDGLIADQRLASPVLGDEGKQSMLDLVPLAGTGWQMADRDRQAKFVSQQLQFTLP
jgi:hypothetical protein